MNRRNRVEGFFGNLKNSARENISRGTVRVRGLVKTGPMVAIAVMSVNIRLGEKWNEQKRRKPKPKMGRPRKVGVTKYAEVFQTLGGVSPPLASYTSPLSLPDLQRVTLLHTHRLNSHPSGWPSSWARAA